MTSLTMWTGCMLMILAWQLNSWRCCYLLLLVRLFSAARDQLPYIENVARLADFHISPIHLRHTSSLLLPSRIPVYKMAGYAQAIIRHLTPIIGSASLRDISEVNQSTIMDHLMPTHLRRPECRSHPSPWQKPGGRSPSMQLPRLQLYI
jgi:hypothetical protein